MKKSILWITTVGLVLTALLNIALAATETPGSDSDPLITSSYLDKKIQEIASGIETAVNSLQAKIEENNSNLAVMDKKVEALSKTTSGGAGSIYEIVNLSAGKKIICESSTEIIVRTGKAKVVSSNSSGLSDVTAGYDASPGSYIETNHLLIVPRTDGRGIIAEDACILMVKGTYSIK